jgi:uncharacterized protein DUF4126
VTLPLDILQGIGLACAAGIRPFLPALLVGALARGDLGVDFSGTDFEFLESPVFLLCVFLALAAVVILQRRLGPQAVEEGPVGNAIAGIGVGIGALLFAGTLADHGYPAWAGIVGGIICALIAAAAARSVFGGARERLDDDAAGALPLYADGISLIVAGLSVLFPPLALIAIAGLVWLLIAGRRRAGRKYAGLRILK